MPLSIHPWQERWSLDLDRKRDNTHNDVNFLEYYTR